MNAVDQPTANAARLTVRPEVRALRAYGLPAGPRAAAGAVRLHQNEAPEDWPEVVKQEVAAILLSRPWHQYPGMHAGAVADAIATLQGTPAPMIAPTSGSNDALRAVFAACAAGGTVVMPSPTYSMAKPLAVVAGARVVEVPLRPEFVLDVAALLAAAHAHRAEAIYLACPNNPTGNAFPRAAVQAVIDGAPGAVVLDEAYWEFARETWLEAVSRHPHVVLIRTFSKAMGAAGLRLGWITAQPAVIEELAKVIPPYSLNIFVQAAAPVLVAHRDIAATRVAVVVAERDRMAAALAAMGCRVYPSETNFLLFEPGYPPTVVWEGLAARGVLVRDVSAAPSLGTCLRVSVGSRRANDRFLEALASVREAVAGERR
ncbi:MAG: histidinol-phosphate transaminase [Armatimonadota bacterium]|nr:histidinol-phosphate transaminase [Armatimonadota bacterium]